ncbi:MAG TPA: bifunctional phosphopantothenoylcysteine decarboxylase/phosphopantothenate--cysteine ligase CoaBC [Candidatus Nitrosopolaris sp.]|nr:bifunctional phosphopantothenoylcysteine decarboxylase/phosphopantothenate--cysteine ligase CoaBC [Candidatus Nitrosopolaris sp.]
MHIVDKSGTHPSKDIVATQGKEILGKKIVLCITGSVAAYKAIDLARLLMRHGAEVYAVMSESAASTLIKADIMEWATGNEVVTKLTGKLEHIALADTNMSDLILVYPCTANTIGKIANGIDDTTVASVLTVALGSRIPIMVVPAMHKSMFTNDIIRQNIVRLKHIGVKFLEPSFEEGKAKVMEPELVLQSVISELTGMNGSFSLEGKNILVTAGSTIEHIDPVRVITNLSSGKMGTAIAEGALLAGAKVTLVYGHGSDSTRVPMKITVIKVNTSRDMEMTILSELSSKRYDIVIFCAAITDFAPYQTSPKKIETRKGKFVLSLIPTTKIIDRVKSISRNDKLFLAAFKAEHNVSDSYLINKAFQKLHECGGDLVIANDLGRKGCGTGSDENEVFIIDRQKKVIHLPLQDKYQVARKILDIIANLCQVQRDPAR